MPGNLFQGQDVARVIEQQMRQWELSKDYEQARLSTGAQIDYISISRELGSGGVEVAQYLAEQMKWQVYDKEILDYMALNMGVHKSVLEHLDEKSEGWIDDWLVPMFSFEGSPHVEQLGYYKHLIKVLLMLARLGRAVIIGRAAGLVLPHHRGLAVRIIAPFELRCENYAKANDLTRDEAVKIVKASDQSQKRFVENFAHKDIDDPANYDLVFNTEKLSSMSVGKLIWRAFDQRMIDQQVLEVGQKKTPDVLVEEQLKQWEASRIWAEAPDRHAYLAGGTQIDYITIERLVGSGGGEVAARLAKLMGWDVYDREILDHMSKNMNVHVRLLAGMDERTRNWVAEGLSPLFANEHIAQERYFEHLAEALLIIARHGKAIILGRAAGKVLPRNKGLSVFVTAPFERRARHIADLDHSRVEDAAKRVKKADHEQGKFVKEFTGKTIDDPRYYDIIFNTDKLSPSAITKLVSRALDLRAADEKEQHEK